MSQETVSHSKEVEEATEEIRVPLAVTKLNPPAAVEAVDQAVQVANTAVEAVDQAMPDRPADTTNSEKGEQPWQLEEAIIPSVKR